MKVKKNMNTSSKVHLAKYLKECGNYTKSQVQDLIKQKRVLVNHHYYPLSYIVKESDIIRVDGMVLSKVPYVYYLYHKPVGIVCTNNLNIKNNIIKQVNLPYRVFCVGRLDKESSGLIILTNDGVFANDLINADKNVEKEYIVTLEKPIDQKLLESLKTPITIRNKITKETRVKIKTLKRIRIGKYKLNGLKENEILKFNGGNDEKI